MTEQTLRAVMLDYLAACSSLTLATAGPEGPWAASVFYCNDGFDLYFLSNPQSRHGRDMARQPQVAAAVNLDYRNWLDIKGIQLEGRAEDLGGISGNLKLARAYVAKFPEVKSFLLSPQKLGQAIAAKVAKVHFYRLAAHRLYFLDNSQGFGHRDELVPAG